MSADVATLHRGLLHEAAYYSSEDEFLSTVVPFVIDGVKAGEPAMATFGRRNAALIRAELGDTADISMLDADAHYTRPASALKTYRDLLVERLADGAQQLRVVGEIPNPGTGMPWEWWARYEATLNHVFDDFPVWVRCTYDTRSTPTEVLADVARTHPHLLTADGRQRPNIRFENPASFLARAPDAGADPLEAAPPMIDLVQPTPAGARRAVLAAGRLGSLDHVEVEEMVYTVSEAVTNALCHGLPPVRLRVWSGCDRMVVTVTDRGHGPADPFAGLLPVTSRSSPGIGLWLIHQICSHATLGTDDGGFTLRMVAGTPGLTA